MNKPLLSIMMPGIRPGNWLNLYNSIVASIGSFDFEIIFVGPFGLPEELEKYSNIKYVKDWGSPTRAFGIALELVEGEYITWAADDATYVTNQLKKVIDHHKKLNDDNLIIAMEQTEAGRHYASSNCYINQHEGIRCLVPDHYIFFPTGLMKTKVYRELGGLDCKYETHAMAHLDFAIRAQLKKLPVFFYTEIVLHLTHMMGSSGDHGPIYVAQTFRDEPLFRKLYRDPSYNPVINLDRYSWQNEPLLWEERFKITN
jgi:hypothetical protein